MATLKIRKSENEFIELPLTTEKPIARSLAVFLDGKVYYCPLVRDGDYLDSGVKIRNSSSGIFALATKIYDPVTHDSSGRTWVTNGYPVTTFRGNLGLFGTDYLTSASSVHITNSSSLEFMCYFNIRDFSDNRAILDCCIVNTIKRIVLFVAPSDKKLKLGVQTTSSNFRVFATLSGALNTDETYLVYFNFKNGVWTCTFDSENEITVSLNLTDADYRITIGADYLGASRFVGTLQDVCFNINGTESRFFFGD